MPFWCVSCFISWIFISNVFFIIARVGWWWWSSGAALWWRFKMKMFYSLSLSFRFFFPVSFLNYLLDKDNNWWLWKRSFFDRKQQHTEKKQKQKKHHRQASQQSRQVDIVLYDIIIFLERTVHLSHIYHLKYYKIYK